MKVYSGAPAAARCYVEADRGRADDYYLTEGTGLARRFTASAGRLTELGPLTGEAYETWVAGRDPESGRPRGRLRSDAHAVRFVEVVVNGPKTWSLAAALHSGDPAFAGLPAYFLERLGPALSALLDAAAATGAIRGDIGAEELLYAVAQLCRPVPGRGPEHNRRIVGVLVDGLRRHPGRP